MIKDIFTFTSETGTTWRIGPRLGTEVEALVLALCVFDFLEEQVAAGFPKVFWETQVIALKKGAGGGGGGEGTYNKGIRVSCDSTSDSEGISLSILTLSEERNDCCEGVNSSISHKNENKVKEKRRHKLKSVAKYLILFYYKEKYPN